MHSGSDFQELWMPKCGLKWYITIPNPAWKRKGWEHAFAAICNEQPMFFQAWDAWHWITNGKKWRKIGDGNWFPIYIDSGWIFVDFGSVLVSFWHHVCAISVSSWYHFRIMLVWFWHQLGIFWGLGHIFVFVVFFEIVFILFIFWARRVGRSPLNHLVTAST